VDNKQIVFKTSTLGGFEKKAVLDYIYNLNEDNAIVQTQLRESIEALSDAATAQEEELREKDEKIASMKKDLESARAELSQERTKARDLDAFGERLKKEIESTRGDFTKERSRARELDELNESMQDEILRHRNSLQDMQAENERLQKEIEMLRRENGSIQEQQSEVDQAIISVGKIMVEARKDAENIVLQAQREAQKIVERATGNAARVEDDAGAQSHINTAKSRDEAARIVEDAKSKAVLAFKETLLTAEEASQGFDKFRQEVSEISSVITDALEYYKDKADELSKLVESSSRHLAKVKDSITSSDFTRKGGVAHYEASGDASLTADEKAHRENFFRAVK